MLELLPQLADEGVRLTIDGRLYRCSPAEVTREVVLQVTRARHTDVVELVRAGSHRALPPGEVVPVVAGDVLVTHPPELEG